MKRILYLLTITLAVFSAKAQTNISAGNVYGTWKKTGSPYKINGQISVPKDSTLRIESGVKVEFQGTYMLHVYGSIQALGKTGDTVLFTPANKTNGWQGIHVHKNKAGADSSLFQWCKFEYVNNSGAASSRGAINLDTISKIRISNSRFQFNLANYGAGVLSIQSNVLIYNCLFYRNQATSNKTNFAGVSGSALNLNFSTVTVKNCDFIENECKMPLNVNDSAQSLSTATFLSVRNNIEVSNCNFVSNKARGISCIYGGYDINQTLKFTNIRMINNYSSNSEAVYLYSTSTTASGTNIYLKNIYFENNKKGTIMGKFNGLGTASAYFCDKEGKNKVLDSIVLINQDGYAAMMVNNEKINKLRIIGSDSIALYGISSTSNKFTLTNSIIVNNGYGIVVEDNTDAFISNSIIAYNGTNNGWPSGGLRMGWGGTYKIFNSIIQNNRWKGKMANIVGAPASPSLKYLKNSIVEGGLDSAKDFFSLGTVITASTLANLTKDTVSFIKPSKGIGAAFYDPAADFHIRNTCSYTYPGLNQGLNTPGDGSTNIAFANTTDLDGNPRINCGTIDIGPYEMEGSKQIVSIDQEPTDQKVCPRSTVTIVPTACGASLGYQWQKSTTSATTGFANIGSANALNYAFLPKDSGWYRLIITQAECNRKDTSVAAKISFKPGSSIAITSQPRDTGICAKSNFNLNAGVQGTNNTYRWQNSKTSATSGFTDISGGTSNPYSQKILDSSWYRLIIKNTLCNYEDTTKASKINKLPLPAPTLGSDQSLAYTGSKVLNPGTFTSYMWSHPISAPATTPTLTVDKNNLTVGTNKVWVEVSNSYGCKGRDTINITLQAADGVLDPATAGIGIYPIPMLNQLQISLPENIPSATYQLTNLAGQKLLNGTTQSASFVDVSSLSAGTYLLTLQAGDRVYGVRVVK